jgi:hypothetical protein
MVTHGKQPLVKIPLFSKGTYFQSAGSGLPRALVEHYRRRAIGQQRAQRPGIRGWVIPDNIGLAFTLDPEFTSGALD